jgi:hypothetical protein
MKTEREEKTVAAENRDKELTEKDLEGVAGGLGKKGGGVGPGGIVAALKSSLSRT